MLLSRRVDTSLIALQTPTNQLLDIAVPRKSIVQLQIVNLNTDLFAIHSKFQLVVLQQILNAHTLEMFHMVELAFTIVKSLEVCFHGLFRGFGRG